MSEDSLALIDFTSFFLVAFVVAIYAVVAGSILEHTFIVCSMMFGLRSASFPAPIPAAASLAILLKIDY